MYPNENGTSVNFAGGNQVTINYTFTIDATWNTQHIELVSFLQDESTKEILQGTMVPIDNLIPLAASAAFSCSNQQPCETTTVDFYDNSLGLITSWNWQFEGGTPASSSAQNPTVTYNTPGLYDVQLIVDDGSVIDTLLLEDYIEVITTPAQANTPSGPSELCGGYDGYEFTTSPVSGATTYTWMIDPASAGTITPNGTSATVDVEPDYAGGLDVMVRADNQCGVGIWSSALSTTVFDTPEQYWISNGAGYCVGTQGVEVTLDGSETGVDYELLLDGDPTGNVMAGTGSMISFGYQTDEGIYTIYGFTDNCESTMYGNCYIHEIDVPGQAATPEGDALACTGAENTYTTAGATDAEEYIWTLSPAEAGVINGNTVEITIVWSDTYVGMASISVMGVNDCGDGPASDALEVDVNMTPQPVVEGDALVCENTPGYVYSSEYHDQATYNWTVDGGTITDGQGTHEITISWGDMGMGYVNLTEVSAADCEGIAATFEVNIDDCVGIDELDLTDLVLYPNPATESINLEFYSETTEKVNVEIINRLGQVVYENVKNIHSGNNKLSFNTTGFDNGYYTIKLITSQGKMTQENFIILK
jgi:PKD repeat protein